MSVLRPLRTLLRRPPSVWWDAARTVVLAGVVELGLRRMPVTRLSRLLGVHLLLDGTPAASGITETLRLSARERQRLDVTWRVLRHRPFNGTCLRRALLAGRVVRHRDHAVRIGVRKVDGVVSAHAWLELDGTVLDLGAVDDFKVLAPVREAA